MSTATDTAHEWIEEICSRFSETTGWNLQFQLHDPDLYSSTLTNDEILWSRNVGEGDHRLGQLILELPETSHDDRSFEMVCSLAELIGQLLDRVMVSSRQIDDHSRELSSIFEIGTSVRSEDNLAVALTELLRASVSLTGFRAACFFLLDPHVRRMKLRATCGLDEVIVPLARRDLMEEPPDLIALLHNSILINAREDERQTTWLPPGFSMGYCASVQSDSGPFGTLWVYDRRSRAVTARETHVVLSVAAQIAAVLERAVLLKESAEQHRLNRELEVASESQAFEHFCTVPPESGFETAAFCSSHSSVGGDLCELIRIDEHHTAVAIGDATGDSVPAALIMASVRGALRSQIDHHAIDAFDTAEVIRMVNRTVYGVTPSHQFMSILYGVIDHRDKTFTYTNAGHPMPIHLHKEQTMQLKSHGMLVGVIPDATYSSSTISLTPGDLLVMYSDGISEAMSKHRKMFRSDGILEIVIRENARSAQDVMQAIWQRVEVHTAGSDYPDDRTLLVIKSLP